VGSGRGRGGVFTIAVVAVGGIKIAGVCIALVCQARLFVTVFMMLAGIVMIASLITKKHKVPLL